MTTLNESRLDRFTPHFSALKMPIEALRGIKALTFDVFGTVVDWRGSVVPALKASIGPRCERGLLLPLPDPGSGPDPGPSPRVLTDGDYAAMAQEWRDSYKRFTRGFRAGETPWKDIDAHHHDSLVDLLGRWGLAGLFPGGGDDDDPGADEADEEVRRLSLVWHRLRPWPDSAPGLHALRAGGELGLVTATLSNGNQSLLADLDSSGGLGFSRLLSAEDFGVYKPDPRVYLGAAEKLGVRPGEVAMVAAHLNDLDAARRLGLRTIYVERKGEEDWSVDDERYEAAKEWVDLWIGLDEDGFVGVARALKSL